MQRGKRGKDDGDREEAMPRARALRRGTGEPGSKEVSGRPDRTLRRLPITWLDLVRRRCRRSAAAEADPAMPSAERVELFDAAMQSRGAKGCSDGIGATFDDPGRQGGSSTAAVLRSFLSRGEIDAVMRARTEPIEVMSAVPRRPPMHRGCGTHDGG